VNLSCGNCKAIRNFSGDPPKCDVCGWVVNDESYDTPYWQDLRRKRHQQVGQLASPGPITEKLVLKPEYGLKQGVENLAGGFLKVVGYLCLALIGWYIFYQFFMPDKTKLADQYHIPESQVFVEPKPHGCDFDDAPLGNKHCHYEKVVLPQRSCDRPDCPVTSVYVSWREVEE